jgi:SAM-dependent methyltransferase
MLGIRLISPDDRSLLREERDYLIDDSGNKYYSVNGTLDLRTKNPIEGSIKYRLIEHKTFRDYQYKESLDPLFPEHQKECADVKEQNVSGFIPYPHANAACLDYGCGAGKMRQFIESYGYNYIGVDNESGTDTEQGGGDAFKGGATHFCDLHRLPFEDNTFQFAISYSVFEHLQNPFVGAAELFRVMEPNGVCFVAVASAIPFHMDSFYHHTHFGVLNTFQSVGFEVHQVAGANWNAYVAISAMDGLPGPRWIRSLVSALTYQTHRFLWRLRTRVQGKDSTSEELRRHLMMAGITKAILIKPSANIEKSATSEPHYTVVAQKNTEG